MENLRPMELDSPLNRRVRAFLAIGPPSEEWLDALERWITPLKRRLQQDRDGIRWTKRESVHLTLRFFGNVSQSDILQIQEIAAPLAAKFRTFTFDTPRLSFFPTRPGNTPAAFTPARIMALDLWDRTSQINDLEKQIRSSLANFGQAPDKRAYRPHLTLARIAEAGPRQRRILFDLWNENGGPNLPPWTARELSLFESKLQPGGSIYSCLRSFAFAA